MLPLVAFELLRGLKREGIAVHLRRLCATDRVFLVMVVVFAVGGFLAIHTIHKLRAFDPWIFHRRHALTAAFLFYLSTLYLLLQRRRIGQVAGLVILLSSCALGVVKLHETTTTAAKQTAKPYQPELAQFLHDNRGPDGSLTVAMRRPQRLAPHTRRVHYHWYNNLTTFDDMVVMVGKLGAEYVVVPRRKRYRFMRDKRWSRQFQLVGRYGGHNVYQPNGLLPENRYP
jgi:hypothetical protein